MKKKLCIIPLLTLLFWFFLDMTGLTLDGNILVNSAYKEDGIFFIIYLILLSFYLLKTKIGYILLNVWLFLWLTTQFISHWYYTIIGSTEKISYFSDTIKLINSTEIYIPDLYHIILHILILISLVCLLTKYKNIKKSN